MRLLPEESLVPTEVDWLGAVPSHWTVRALKWDTPVLRGASPRPIADPKYFDDDGEYAWVRIADVSSAGTYLEKTTQRLSQLGASLSVKLGPGDLFLSIAGTVGKPCITKIKCCIHDGFVYFPRLSAVPKFLYYVLASGRPYGGLGKLGTQLNLNTDTVGSIRMGFPPKGEQRAIADFLDRKTAAIDALLAQKERLIALLQEKRQALITQAVTKGLDPNVPMKDSGIEWLGEIPAHWSALSVKRACTSVRDGTHNPPPRFPDGEHRLLSARNIQGGRFMLRDDDRRMTASAFAELERSYTVRRDDVVLACVGATTGKSAVVGVVEHVSVQRSLAILRPNPRRILSSYLNLWLTGSAAQHEIKLCAGKYAAQGGIYLDDVANLCLALPPVREQQAILHYVEPQLDAMSRVDTALNDSCARLREYRKAVITAAVTGKLDVTSEAA